MSGVNMDIKMLHGGGMGPFTVCSQPSLVAASAWCLWKEGLVEWLSWAASGEVQGDTVLRRVFPGVLSQMGVCQGRGL